jgi:nicotinate-nucleotide pyrophosphorylase (carboxylating)
MNNGALNREDIIPVIERALAEDVGDGDVTTKWTVPFTKQAKAKLVTKVDGVVAGLGVAQWVFEAVDESIVFDACMADGDRVVGEDVLAEISGSARALLTGERLALNFLQRMSGIATMTGQFVEAVKGTNARILDTRKTVPGLRLLDKYAVAAGGGVNHRVGLYDMVLVKENHIEAADGIGPALLAVWKGMDFEGREVPVEVEVETLRELDEVLVLGADRVMLDNMSLDEMREAVEKVRNLKGKIPELEASGNVSLEAVREIAETGVDLISVGALTHSVKALDISMLFR